MEVRNSIDESVYSENGYRQGTLIMDEVDLILHPLKSELNYPIGPKEALDFTESKIGLGMRWELPFVLLDPLFYAFNGKIKENWRHR